jgi:hypothetical protein
MNLWEMSNGKLRWYSNRILNSPVGSFAANAGTVKPKHSFSLSQPYYGQDQNP